MSKFCPYCGFENTDDAHFCVDCGKHLIDLDEDRKNTLMEANSNNKLAGSNQKIPIKYASYHILDISDCILCKNHNFYHLNKKSLMSNKEVYFCSECGITLEKANDKFKLIAINDQNERIWQLYHFQTLTNTEWIRIADGGLSNEDQERLNKQMLAKQEEELQLHHKEDLDLFVNQLKDGEIQFNNVQSSLIVKKDERVLLDIPNVSLNEPRAVRVSQGGGVGTSVRVAKGVSVHSGGAGSRSVSHDEIMNVDAGNLIITNKRLVFTGSKKTVNINLNSILTITAYKDGISIQRENKQKVEYFVGTNKSNLSFTIDDRHQSAPLEGYIVKAAILGQISNL
ncbi:MAG: zinc ribbon domain-containing protein [Methanobrevibacter sp.]|nr:zinc ribbon domain-containing protein [Methanobrevibacter sp.]